MSPSYFESVNLTVNEWRQDSAGFLGQGLTVNNSLGARPDSC